MAERDDHGRFRRGSGNPAGRPKGFAGLARLIQEQTDDGAELVEFALAVFRDPDRTIGERMQAHAWLSDRGYGKAVQQTELVASISATATRIPAELGAMSRNERLAWLSANAPHLLKSGG